MNLFENDVPQPGASRDEALERASGILVIDDDEVARGFYKNLLDGAGYRVSLAASGEEGLALMEQAPFDLLIVDVRLNGMGGIEVLRKAKQIDPDVEVIMVTAAATIESTLQTLQFGGFDYLIKTDQNLPEVTLHRVVKALHKRKLVLENKNLLIHITRKDRELEEKIDKLQHLVRFINDVNNLWTLQDVKGCLEAHLLGILGVGFYSIYLYDRDAKGLRLFSEIRAQGGRAEPPGRSEQELMDEALRQRQPVAMNGSGKVFFLNPPSDQRSDVLRTSVAISIPLLSGRRMIGILNITDKEGGGTTFTDEDVYRVSILGESLAAAIHNHHLAHELRGKIDELNESILRLEETQAQLIQTEKLAAMSTLVAGVAHEIKNPLNAMALTVENLDDVLKMQTCPPARCKGCVHADEIVRVCSLAHKYTSMLISEISRLKKLIENFLDLTRPTELKCEPVFLERVIREVLDELEPQTAKLRIKTVKRLDKNAPPAIVHADAVRRILLNVLLNAMEAMPKGGAVSIDSFTEGDMFCVVVRDTGPGIPEKYLAKVFEPFFSTKSGGVGLGLSLVYRSMEAMGGRIEILSREGEGATVRLLFPTCESKGGTGLIRKLFR